jgi:hypothetical protein
MATIERAAAFPHILIVTGPNLDTPGYRTPLRDALYAAGLADSPVRQGTHDFWITYQQPATGGANWSFEDLSKQPRKMRGIVEMGAVPGDSTAATLRGHITTILQEVGHHWLVPANLRFNTPDGTRSMPSAVQLIRLINAEDPLGIALLARADSHWSAYFQADASPMDGNFYVRRREEDGFAVWESADFAGPVVDPPDLPAITLPSSFNDLDRVVMGTKTPANAYASTNGSFRWLEPRLSAPHRYDAGLFLAFDRSNGVIFGFHDDHRQLAVQRIGRNQPDVTVSLGAGYRPLQKHANGVALRIVRRGRRYHFQARWDITTEGPRAPGLGDALSRIAPVTPNPAFDATTFRTVATLELDGDPLAIGTVVRKPEHPYLAELAFSDFTLFEGEKPARALRTDAPLRPFPRNGDYARLPPHELRAHIPAAGPIVGTKNGRLHILAPFSTVDRGNNVTHHDDFDLTATSDRAPKVLTKAPTGNFAFAAKATIWRTIFTPWAGGVARGKTIWGIERSLAASGAVVPQNVIDDKQPPPPANTYRCAFIVTARQRSDIEDGLIARLDVIRRYWDEAFAMVTEQQRHSDSRLTDAGILRVTPTSINFGRVVIGEVSNPETIRIINDGLGDLGVTVAASTTGAFRWESVSEVIPPGGERQLEVEFMPTSTSSSTRTLSVQNDSGPPRSVDLRGRGTDVIIDR